MSDRYAKYSKLKIDHPSDRVLRVKFDRPETYNSVDAETHTQLTNIWRDINDDPDCVSAYNVDPYRRPTLTPGRDGFA